jgi:hypothetical protein
VRAARRALPERCDSFLCPEADPEAEEFAPIRLMHEVLVRDGQMSDREAATLIDNSFLSLAQSGGILEG